MAEDHRQDHGSRPRRVTFNTGLDPDIGRQADALHDLLSAVLADNAGHDMAGLCAAVCAANAVFVSLIAAAMELLGPQAPEMLRLAGVTLAGSGARDTNDGEFLMRMLVKIERAGSGTLH